MSYQYLVTTRRVIGLVAVLGVAACSETATSSGGGYLTTLPDRLIEVAAPGQDLSAVRLNPDDGCFWYRYDGPVEVTMLPLRTREGRPICTQASQG